MLVLLRWMISGCAALAVLLALGGTAHAQEKRIALLIGNSSYSTKVGPLKNPGNDIAGVRQALIAAGFRPDDIRVVANATRFDVKREVDAFAGRASKLTPADVAFFYYSGHGAWRPGSRSMSIIPIDATDAATEDFWYSTINLDDEVLRTFNSSRSQAAWIIAIDACRNELRLPTKDLGGSGDKAFQALPSQAGMLISFAADEGQTARDLVSGESYSPYAASLIESLSAPGLSASTVFGRLRPAVIRRTGGAQQPVLTNKLNVDPVLNAFAPPVADPKPVSPLTAAVPAHAAVVAPPPNYLDARSTPSTTRAPLISGDPKSLPDFALFRECEGCPEMVILPAGTFAMGSPANEAGRRDNEGPQRQVSITRFAISRFETTWDEWDACVATGACNGAGPQVMGGDWSWGKGRRPVVKVDLNDARTFAGFATGRTGATYRLPSEAEWEYAARAGSGDRYAWGAADPNCDQQAFTGANFAACTDDRTRPVGSFRASRFGLFDLHGNVWEWIEDCSAGNYSAGQLTNGSAHSPASCSSRVNRGGSWSNRPQDLRSANRVGINASWRVIDLGFRLARTL
jgi:formylglycine-generating enzyme required for sulfatase activity/uncharacterized caspase-like protein